MEKNNLENFNFKIFWKKLWSLISGSQKQIIYLIFVLAAFELSKFISPYILKKIIDLITNFDADKIKLILTLIFAILFTELLMWLLDYLADKKIFRLLVNIEYEISLNLQSKMMELSLNYHEKENTGNKISKIQRGIDKVLDLLGNLFWEIIPTIIQVISTSVILFFFDWRFGLVFFVFVPIFIKFTADLNFKIYPYRKIRHDKYEQAAGKMVESIMNINTVKSFVQEKRETQEYRNLKTEIKSNHLKEFFKTLSYNYLRGTAITFGRVFILLFGAYLVWTGGITIGSLVFIITISEKAFSSLFRISRLYDRIMDSSEAITRLDDLKQQKSEILNKTKGIKPKNLNGRIKFQNLSYSYDNSNYKALNNINLTICSDCITALVGPSGGGKTTLARMIYRHYDSDEGTVKIDDIDLRDYDLYSFRKFIAIVPQEVEIFNLSVKDNISYANPGSDIKDIIAAAKIANAHEFISQLNLNYDTLVGERGIRLSGGQRQRIGIARAILANPKIIIFDEATSNLDSYSEKLIQEALDRVSHGRTVIIIAHRLSTIKKADKIIVLENGKVMEQGSHFELSKIDGGLYAKLLKLQEMGDID